LSSLVRKRCYYGKNYTPSETEIKNDINKWVSLEEKLENPDQMIDFQTEYTKELHSLSDYPKIDFELIRKALLKSGNITKLKTL
jgi:hypothetical protein